MKAFRNVGSIGVVLAIATTPGAILGAQVSAAVGLGGIVHRTGTDVWASTSRANPVLRIDGRWAQLNGNADLWGGTDGVHLQHGALDVIAAPSPVGPFRLTTTAHVERLATSPAFERTVGTIESAVSLRVANGGGWLGLAAERAREIDSASVQPLLRAGVWQRFGMMTLALSAESHRARLGGRASTYHEQMLPADSARDTLTGDWVHFPARFIHTGDSGAPSRAWLWSDIQARLGWTTSRLSLDARFGVQPRIGTTARSLWARGGATMSLAPRLALVASGGVHPSSVWLGTPSSRFLSVGLRVAPAALLRAAPPPFVRPTAASFVVRRADDDSSSTSFIVAVRVPDARAVELSGDFNGWTPIVLREARPGVWEAAVTLVPGTHRISMRVNGDSWIAPPGVPTTDDDFNGTVGLIVVR